MQSAIAWVLAVRPVRCATPRCALRAAATGKGRPGDRATGRRCKDVGETKTPQRPHKSPAQTASRRRGRPGAPSPPIFHTHPSVHPPFPSVLLPAPSLASRTLSPRAACVPSREKHPF